MTTSDSSPGAGTGAPGAAPATAPPPSWTPPAPPYAGPQQSPPRPWARSTSDRVIAGVCGGIAERLGIDPIIVRVFVVVLSFFAGAGIALYAFAWLFMDDGATGRSIAVDAFSGTSGDRTRSVLVTIGLLVVLVAASGLLFSQGFMPALLVALAVLCVLLLARRDPSPASGGGQPAYPPPVAPMASGPATATTGWPAAQAPQAPAFTAPPAGAPAGAPPPAAAPVPFAPPAPAAEPTMVERTAPAPWPAAGGSAGAPPPPPPVVPAWVPPPVAPPPPPRPRSYLGLLTGSAVLVAMGVLAIIDQSGVSVPATAYVATALAITAAGLLVGAWIGRSRGLIVLGSVLTLALAPAFLIDAVGPREWINRQDAERLIIVPQSVGEIDQRYEFRFGSVELGLTQVDFEDTRAGTSIDLGVGEVKVIVPPNVDVYVETHVSFGESAVFNHRDSGVDNGVELVDRGADGLGGGRLDLRIDVGAGRVEVSRATS